ncbi:sigma-54 dependent transcriptional regulator [Elizabethkingia anophelis]|uniref:RNA repair transcriptional activator RtcR family protein n=1 Tax=Elizabethkingia anophelis TaxID=1117645 RepID=UPI000BA849DC|nr:sigma-54 dependent transcriptional regulator [Elizabethkingia anophelis]ASV78487.1 sigma-54-dependent Fis family transcriptional regulator [Elizabethkingia anophelis]MCL1647679.1 sigma-54 dependent transcriptional regulator [Elizabethkingia anophelis]MCL1683073.1 sigma-54 dependent transcriptional regulator [Elizabethkingia anophelis]MDV3867726.1 Fis family transcriptional regulator [Elizabethkingia anophelis]MDV3962485.1 Fis family transcriptional regulator [Elizabethkingia anophelis]
MKTLISWIATMHDFSRNPETKQVNGVNESGPTFNFHKDFYKHDRHVILSAEKGIEPDIYIEQLRTELNKKYPDRKIETQYLDITDVIDISQIKSKVEGLLIREYKDDEINIFFSPGTSAMQISWYLIHESGLLNTKLYQVRPERHSKTGKAELLDMHVVKSTIPGGSIIKEESVVYHKENYLITASLEQIYSKAEMIAKADQVTTLIFGESGSGKEHLASYIHNNSARNQKPFVAINCSAFTDGLLESRLFGHTKGAFTGAVTDHKGLLEEANGGTIFLDEIGDISPYMQQLLLRVIQEKKILRIGDVKEKKIDVRIIAATNRNLPQLCAEGSFRWDLFYRLAVTELTIPPLRDRGAKEKKELIDFFIESKRKLFKRPKKLRLEKDIEQFILNYPFPGNVREVENLIENLYVFNNEVVSRDTLPVRLLNPSDESKLDLKTVEKLHIIKVLKIAKSKQHAAKLLGCVINTLEKKIKDYNIEN